MVSVLREDRKGWSLAVSSFEAGEGEAANAIDGDTDTFWHTQWSGDSPKHPHTLTVDMKKIVVVTGVELVHRLGNPNGRIGRFSLQVSLDGNSWQEVVRDASCGTGGSHREILPKPVQAGHIRLVALTEVTGKEWTSLAEFYVLKDQ